MNDRLAGKIALVTGAANGIGEGCADAFAKAGATVIAVDQLDAPGIRNCNLLDEDQVRELVAEVTARHEKIDILVNAAAFAVFKWLEDMSYTDWRGTLAGELDIVFLLTRAAWPLLKASGGASVINFASANAAHALPGSAAIAHCAGKGGILAMNRQLAMEGAPFGIRCNVISPGFILTRATSSHLTSVPALKEAILAKNMVKRLGAPKDVAMCALWLASDESGYVTAANVPVDGGATAW